jgi:hypothetical protein
MIGMVTQREVARMDRIRGGVITTTLLILLGIAVAGGFLVWFFYCPCDRTPGGYLLGDEASEPVDDWSFANVRTTVPLCQIQVSTAFLPHSVNLNCMAVNGELYLSCAGCDGKYWSTAVLHNPQARVRAGKLIYPVTVTRVLDPATLDAAWAARAAKMGRSSEASPRPDHWWSFHVTSR